MFVFFNPVCCTKYVPLFWLSAAMPMHHHGQDCLRLKVDVVGHKGSGKTQVDKSKTENTGKRTDEGKGIFPTGGGVHNPSNRLPAGEDSSLKNATLSNHSSPMPVRRLSGCVLSWRNGEIQCWLPFLSSDDPAVMEPKVQRSIGSSGTQPVSFPLLFTMIPFLLALMLRWGWQPQQRLSKAHAGHWDHETLRFFLYRLFYMSMHCAFVFVCVNAERWSFQRRWLKDLFLLLYTMRMEVLIFQHLQCKLFSRNKQNCKLNNQKHFWLLSC